MDEKLKESFKRTLEALASFAKEAQEETDELLTNAIEEFLTKYKPLGGTEQLWMLREEFNNILAKHLRKEKYNEECINILIAYDFCKDTISNLMVKLEGSACSVDKADYILKKSMQKTESESINWENEKWYAPKYGDLEEWKHLVDGLTVMFHTGNPDSFFNSYNHILNIYKEKDGK